VIQKQLTATGFLTKGAHYHVVMTDTESPAHPYGTRNKGLRVTPTNHTNTQFKLPGQDLGIEKAKSNLFGGTGPIGSSIEEEVVVQQEVADESTTVMVSLSS
jgi:hypothetical protein